MKKRAWILVEVDYDGDECMTIAAENTEPIVYCDADGVYGMLPDDLIGLVKDNGWVVSDGVVGRADKAPDCESG